MTDDARELLERILKMPPENMTAWEQIASDYLSENLETIINEDRARFRDTVTLKELATLLGTTTKTLRKLPLTIYKPFRQTSRGRRQVSCVRMSEVLAYMKTQSQNAPASELIMRGVDHDQ